MSNCKDKIWKLVRLYKIDPNSNEGKLAYKKARDLITKNNYALDEFCLNYSIVPYEDKLPTIQTHLKPPEKINKVGGIITKVIGKTAKAASNLAKVTYKAITEPTPEQYPINNYNQYYNHNPQPQKLKRVTYKTTTVTYDYE